MSRVTAVVALAGLAFALVARGTSGEGATPRHVCGTVIADPNVEVPTWYVDATSDRTQTVRLPVPIAPPDAYDMAYLRVSPSCDTGAEVRLTGPKIIRFGDRVHTKDHRLAVIQVFPIRLGRTTLGMTETNAHSHAITIDVVARTAAPSS